MTVESLIEALRALPPTAVVHVPCCVDGGCIHPAIAIEMDGNTASISANTDIDVF